MRPLVKMIIITLMANLIQPSTSALSCCPFVSTELAYDFSNNLEGPLMNLSATVIENGGDLQYRCIEPGKIGLSNRFLFKGTSQQWISTAGVTRQNTQTCLDHRIYRCTHRFGSIRFNDPSKAGLYRCSSSNHEVPIYWFEKEVKGTPLVIANDSVISYLDLYCQMTTAPMWASFSDIVLMTWMKYDKNKNLWEKLSVGDSAGSDNELIHPKTGSNFTLRRNGFQRRVHTGIYRCSATIGTRDERINETFISPNFTVTAPPKVGLSNSLNEPSFIILLGQPVNLTCIVESYPPIDRIQIMLKSGGAGGTEITNSAWQKSTDLTPNHTDPFATIIISNATIELNESVLLCLAMTVNPDDSSGSLLFVAHGEHKILLEVEKEEEVYVEKYGPDEEEEVDGTGEGDGTEAEDEDLASLPQPDATEAPVTEKQGFPLLGVLVGLLVASALIAVLVVLIKRQLKKSNVKAEGTRTGYFHEDISADNSLTEPLPNSEGINSSLYPNLSGVKIDYVKKKKHRTRGSSSLNPDQSLDTTLHQLL